MCTFSEIVEANKLINTTPIRGKQYAEVPQRVKAFRSLFPMGSITTEILKLEDGVVYMKATATDENGRILATGMAYEKESSSMINKTSFIENCETSAVGRCLSFLGLGIDVSIASAEEVTNAINAQEAMSAPKEEPKKAKKEEVNPEEKISKTMCGALLTRISNENGLVKTITDLLLKSYKIETLNELTIAQYEQINRGWSKLIEKAKDIKANEGSIK